MEDPGAMAAGATAPDGGGCCQPLGAGKPEMVGGGVPDGCMWNPGASEGLPWGGTP